MKRPRSERFVGTADRPLWYEQPVSTRRTVTLFVVGAVVLASGCAASRMDRPEQRVAPTVAIPATPASTAIDARESDSARWGDGRALTARYSAAADRLVVITTVGFAIQDGFNEAARLIERGMTDVSSAALSPDGRFLAVADGSRSALEIWDFDTGAIAYEEATNAPTVLGFTSDGGRLLYSSPTSVSSWSPDGTVAVLIESQVSDQLGTVAVSRDGGRVVVAATGASTGSVFEWVESTGVRTIDLGLASGVGPGRMALAGDGSKMVFEVPSSTDPAVTALEVVDTSTGVAQELSIDVRPMDGSHWVFGPDDRVIVAEAGALTFYDLDGAVVGRSDLNGLSTVVSMTGPTDGDSVVTAHEDGSLNAWSLTGDRSGEMPATVRGIREVIRPDGASALTVGYSGLIDRWAVGDQRSVGLIDRYAGGVVTGLAISPENERVALAHSNGVVEIRDLQSGEVETSLDHGGRRVAAVEFSPDSSEIATGVGERLRTDAFDDSLTVWSSATGSTISVRGGEGESVAGCSFFRPRIRFSPNGEVIAASSHDFTVALYDAGDLEPILTLSPQGGTILDLAFSPDGEVLATSSEDLKLRLWDVATGRLVAEHDSPLGGYWGIAFMPDGTSLVTVGATGAVELIGLTDGAVIRSFDESSNWSSGIALSNDGSLFAAGGKDNEVIIWSVTDGSVLQRLQGHTGPVNAVAMSGDGSLVVSGSEDGTARRWPLGN